MLDLTDGGSVKEASRYIPEQTPPVDYQNFVLAKTFYVFMSHHRSSTMKRADPIEQMLPNCFPPSH